MLELKQNEVVIYKNKYAIIIGFNNDKTITIHFEGAVIRVKREELS